MVCEHLQWHWKWNWKWNDLLLRLKECQQGKNWGELFKNFLSLKLLDSMNSFHLRAHDEEHLEKNNGEEKNSGSEESEGTHCCFKIKEKLFSQQEKEVVKLWLAKSKLL